MIDERTPLPVGDTGVESGVNIKQQGHLKDADVVKRVLDGVPATANLINEDNASQVLIKLISEERNIFGQVNASVHDFWHAESAYAKQLLSSPVDFRSKFEAWFKAKLSSFEDDYQMLNENHVELTRNKLVAFQQAISEIPVWLNTIGFKHL